MRPSIILQGLRSWARTIKQDVVALYLAAVDPRVPRLAKIVAVCVAAYALSPIDLIPDFIPILGYLDDLVILPLGIMLAVKLVPADLMSEFRAAAVTHGRDPVLGKAGAAIIVSIWILGILVAVLWLITLWKGN
jgi:uncharacterized membrane protein YkvA (DUF1232 family)